MTQYERLAKIANLYISSRKRIRTIDKELFPEKYEKCKETIRICALILARNGVQITL